MLVKNKLWVKTAHSTGVIDMYFLSFHSISKIEISKRYICWKLSNLLCVYIYIYIFGYDENLLWTFMWALLMWCFVNSIDRSHFSRCLHIMVLTVSKLYIYSLLWYTPIMSTYVFIYEVTLIYCACDPIGKLMYNITKLYIYTFIILTNFVYFYCLKG